MKGKTFPNLLEKLLQKRGPGSNWVKMGISIVYGLKKRILKQKNEVLSKSNVMISPRYKFIYLRNPKVANSNFCKSILKLDDTSYYITIDKNEFGTLYKDYFVFSFVRNPWQRIYSAYKNKICFPQKVIMIGYYISYSGLYHKMPFSEYIDFLFTDEGKDDYTDNHWVSQSELLSYKDKLICNYVGKLEEQDKGLDEIEKQINVRLEIEGHEKRNYKGKNGYLDFYTKDLINQVYKRYKKDCMIFDYTLENQMKIFEEKETASA